MRGSYEMFSADGLSDEVKEKIQQGDSEFIEGVVESDDADVDEMLKLAISQPDWRDSEELTMTIAVLAAACDYEGIKSAMEELDREDDMHQLLEPIILSQNTDLLKSFVSKVPNTLKEITDDTLDLLKANLDSTRSELLYFLIRDGCISHVTTMLDENPDIINAPIPSKSNSTPLHGAAWYTRLPIVKLLLSYGADTNTINDKGESPLTNALQRGDVDVSFQILERATAETVEIATEQVGCKDTSLYLSAKAGDLGKVLRMTENLRANGLAQQMRSGSTPSHAAAYYEHPECLTYLVETFPDSCNIMNNMREYVITNCTRGITLHALVQVVKNTRDDILTSYPTHDFCEGNTMAHLAVYAEKESLVNALMGLVDWNFTNNVGQTPHDIAIQLGASGIVAKLEA